VVFDREDPVLVLRWIVTEYLKIQRTAGVHIYAPKIFYPVEGKRVFEFDKRILHNLRRPDIKLFGQVLLAARAENIGRFSATQSIQLRLLFQILERNRAYILRSD